MAKKKSSTSVEPKKPTKVFGHKRHGHTTAAEQNLVEQFVLDTPHEITKGQEMRLAALMGRSTEAVRSMIQRARNKFTDAAEEYVDTHLQATQGALQKGDYHVAVKAAQWAMENISVEGERIIDKVDTTQQGPRVFVGIKLGGLGSAMDDASATPTVVVETPSV